MEAARAAVLSSQQTEALEPVAEVSPHLPRSFQEIHAEHRANREERRRRREEARQEAEAVRPTFSLPQSLEEALEAAYGPARTQVTVRQVVTRKRPPPPVSLPLSQVPLAELLDLEALRPKRGLGAGTDGPIRYVELLHLLAGEVVKAKGYRFLPKQAAMLLSNEMMAAVLNVSTVTIWKWNKILRKLGYLDNDRHYGSSLSVRVESEHRRKAVAKDRQEGRRPPARASRGTHTRTSRRKPRRDAVCDGTVYAIRLQPGHMARLTYEDLNHQYRDLDKDRKEKRTAHAILKQAYEMGVKQGRGEADQHGEKKWQGSYSHEGRMYIFDALKAWAVQKPQTQNPLNAFDPCHFPEEGTETVQDVIYTLELVETAHPSKRTALVGHLAATLAKCLKDEHSHRHYCKLIWQAYRDTLEGRGGLKILAAQLARLDVDRREWVELRNPAALLAARMLSA